MTSVEPEGVIFDELKGVALLELVGVSSQADLTSVLESRRGSVPKGVSALDWESTEEPATTPFAAAISWVSGHDGLAICCEYD